MAFLATDPNQQDPNNPNQQPGTTGAPAGQGVTLGGNSSGVLSGTSGGSIGGNSAPGSAAAGGTSLGGNNGVGSNSGTTKDQSAATNSGNSAPNLTAYVTANQGNDGAMGTAVNNTVGSAAATADTAGSGFQSNAQQVIGNNTITEDGGVKSTLTGIESGANTAGGKAATGAQAFGATPDAAFQKTFNTDYNAAYNGPADHTGFSNYQPTQQDYQKVTDYGTAVKNGDTGGLLTDTYAKQGQQYTNGEHTLDQFILGAGAQGAQALRNIGNQYGNYNSKLDAINSGLDNGISGAKTTDAQTARDVQAQAQAAYGGVQGRIGDANSQATAANAKNTATTKAIASGDPAALKAAGFNDSAIAFLAGKHANYQNYANTGSKYGIGDFVNAQDVANYNGLASLIGGAGGTVAPQYSADQLAAKGGATAGGATGYANAANTLASFLPAAQKRAAAMAQSQANSYNAVKNSLGSSTVDPTVIANELGISTADYNKAKAGNIDLSRYLQQDKAEGLGDELTAAQRAQLPKLSNLLGISVPTAVMGSTNGKGYTFDSGGFGQALSALPPPVVTNGGVDTSKGVSTIPVDGGQPLPSPGGPVVLPNITQYVAPAAENVGNVFSGKKKLF